MNFKSMLLLITIFISVSYSSFAEATECPVDAADTLTMITNAGSCYEASKIANECAWGSSVDVGLAGAASEICLKDMNMWSDKHKLILSTLVEDCNRKYEDQMGTLYLSMNAFCRLGVAELLSNLNEEVF